jgi:hypothetical protein
MEVQYIVDDSLDWKNSVRAASTGNVSLTGSTPLTVDGITIENGNRLLLKNQGTGSQNGIYICTITNSTYSLTRSLDANSETLSCGAATYVEEGSTNGSKIYIMSTTGAITVDSTSLTWTEFSGGGGASPGGSDTYIQFNDGGSFGGDADLRFNKTTGALTGTYVVASTGFSGSLTKLTDGTSYLRAGTNVTISTGSNGAVTIEASGGGGSSSPEYWLSTTSQSVYTTGSVIIRGASTSVDSPADIGSNVFFYVSGTFSSSIAASRVSSFGGDVHVSGNLKLEASNQNKEVELFLKNSASTSFPNVNGSSIVFGIYSNSTQDDYDAKIKAEITSLGATPRTKLVFNTNDADGRVERMRIKGDSSDGTLISVGTEDANVSTVTFLSRKDKTSNTQNFWAFGGSNLGEVGGTRYPTGIVFRHYNDNPFGAGVSSNPRSTSTYGSGLRFWTSTNQSDIRGVIDIGTNGDLIMGSNDGSSPTHPGVIRPAEQQSSLSQSSVLLRIRGANATGGSDLAGGSLILSGGLSTGNASGGSIIFGVSPPGSAGSTSNDTVEVMRIASGLANIGPVVGIGVTGTNSARLFISGTTSHSNGALLVKGGNSTDPIVLYRSNTNTVVSVFDATGSLGLGTSTPTEKIHVSSGNIRVDTSGYGVRFPSSPSNSDSQTLDSYNESTISARFYSAASGGVTMATGKDTLNVTRVGRLVTITGFLKADAGTKPSLSGRLAIDTSVSTSPPLPSVSTGAAIWIDLFQNTMADPVQAYIDPIDGFIYIDRLVNGSKADLASYIEADSEVRISVTYVAA